MVEGRTLKASMFTLATVDHTRIIKQLRGVVEKRRRRRYTYVHTHIQSYGARTRVLVLVSYTQYLTQHNIFYKTYIRMYMHTYIIYVYAYVPI